MESETTILNDPAKPSVALGLGPRGRGFKSLRPDSENKGLFDKLAERTVSAGLQPGLRRKPHEPTGITFPYGTPEYRRAYYVANRERMKAANAAYKKQHPDRAKKYKQDYADRHPERDRARLLVLQAVRRGELVRQPCERCGNPDSEGHHDDYSKPLEVTWLCPQHHADRHRELRAIRNLELAVAARGPR